MTGKRRLTKSIKGLDVTKQDKPRQVRGILGNVINGSQVVEVPTRPGYVWVRLRDQQSEIIQAFNDNVSPVYDLPVFVTRDSNDPTRYIIVGRDTAQYANWGAGAAYLPRHANQHSFSDDAGAAGDVVWVYGRQFMPLLAYPSGSAGANNVIISPYTYFAQSQTWVYSGGTGTASITAYKPTGSNARVVLVYMDVNGNPQLSPGDYFAATITGTSQVIQYLPDLPTNSKPIAAIRLVSGTSIINWSNIYDVRQFYSDSVVAPTSTPSLGIAVYEDHVFKATGTVLDFTDNMNIAVSGSSVFISSVGGGGGGTGTTVGARVYRTADYIFTGTGAGVGIEIPFTHERWDTDGIHSGSSSQLYCNTPGYYYIAGNVEFAPAGAGGARILGIKLNSGARIAEVEDAGSTTAYHNLNVSCVHYLNAGDYVKLVVDRATAIAETVVASSDTSPEFMMQRFGDAGSSVISTGTVIINQNTYQTDNQIPIFDDGIFKVTGTAISFDTNLSVIVSGTVAFVSSAASGGGLSALPIQDNGVFVVSGTAISFDKDLIVTASGTVAHVEIPSNTFASGSHTHPAGAVAIQIYEDGIFQATGTLIDFQDNINVFVTGTVAFISVTGVSLASDDANISAVNFLEQVTDPSTPGANHRLLFAKPNGIYEMNSSGFLVPLSQKSIQIYEDGAFKATGTLVSFNNNLDVIVSGTSVYVNSTSAATSIPTYPAIYEKGSFVATGTSITFDGNVDVSASGAFVSVLFPISTYQRVAQPNPLNTITGSMWQTPERVYASGSLAVFLNGLIQIIDTDYREQFFVSGTYQYLKEVPTGTVHMIMYGIPCSTQTQPGTGGASAFALLDSNDVLLLDSNSVQLLDSNG